MTEIDDKINRLLERLPEPGAAADQDGPVEPLAFRLNGTLYEHFRPAEWRLLKCLWGKDGWAATIEEVISTVYGVNAEGKDKAIVSTVKRLSHTLLHESIPLFVRQQAGYLILDQAGSTDGSC